MLKLPPREIPVPTSISPEAQQALAAPKIGGPSRWPPAGDKPAWRRALEEGDARIAALFGALPAFPGSIVARRVASATVYELTPHAIAPEKLGRAILLSMAAPS